MRESCGATFLPPRKRGSASDMPVTQRQRVVNIGASSKAWISRGLTVFELRYRDTSASSKLCAVVSDKTILSSVAAACSSKLNLRQNRLRSARPQARLIRLPNGEWMTSCMPPASSKKRSKTIVSWVGKVPSAACDDIRYSTTSREALSDRPTSFISQRRGHSAGGGLPMGTALPVP